MIQAERQHARCWRRRPEVIRTVWLSDIDAAEGGTRPLALALPALAPGSASGPVAAIRGCFSSCSSAAPRSSNHSRRISSGSARARAPALAPPAAAAPDAAIPTSVDDVNTKKVRFESPRRGDSKPHGFPHHPRLLLRHGAREVDVRIAAGLGRAETLPLESPLPFYPGEFPRPTGHFVCPFIQRPFPVVRR